tara:strand:- start:20 stop:289 length:270 start_codon:yes stop_codon:yes gene_type:complete
MKKTLFLIIFTLLFNINAQAIILFKNNNSVTLNQNMNYFIKKGFKIVAQDTRGIITAYVLKKDEEYVGCRTEGLSKKLTCYSVSLKDND